MFVSNEAEKREFVGLVSDRLRLGVGEDRQQKGQEVNLRDDGNVLYLAKAILRRKDLEESCSLTSDYTTKLPPSKEYGTGTKTDT